jgi:cobalt-zinc-cadmium efflux system protein
MMSQIIFTLEQTMTSYVEHGTGDADHQHQHNYKLAHYLGWALFLTGGFALVEAIGGWYSGSLALISDAGHMLTDTMALALAYFAQKLSSRAPSAKLSFGYTRIEVIAAFVNALGMLALVAWIMIQAVQRVMNPTSIDGGTVSIIAFGGLLVNLLVAWLLHRDQSSLNARAAFVHVLGDLLGSVAAIVAGLLIYYKGWQLADPILSVFVALLIVRSTWGILKDALWHLMDAVPNHIDFNRVGASLHAVEGIISVHDLHIWSMSPEQPTLMAHVLIEPHTPWPDVLERARVMLRQEYQIDHITLQPEWRTMHAADDAATEVEGSRPKHVH